ncbi:MAG: LPXTG cell wall anchor domain-containing protein, partial [Micromonosporaceae bacterium]
MSQCITLDSGRNLESLFDESKRLCDCARLTGVAMIRGKRSRLVTTFTAGAVGAFVLTIWMLPPMPATAGAVTTQMTGYVTPARNADLDCADFRTQRDAQRKFNSDRSDPHRLDADNDKIACEVLPGGADLDCADFRTQRDAQREFNSDRSDPHGLDADNDMIACEHLPGEPSSSTSGSPADTTKPAAAGGGKLPVTGSDSTALGLLLMAGLFAIASGFWVIWRTRRWT